MLVSVGGVVVAVLVVGSGLIGMFVDWLWFGQVGFGSVFSTVLVTRLVQGGVVGLLIGGLLALNVVIAYRVGPVFVPARSDDPVGGIAA